MPRFLVLDADAGGGALLAVSVDKRGSLAVESALSLPAGAAALGEGAAASGTALRDALKTAKVAPAPLLVLVGRDRVIIKDVKHPPTPPADEPAVVRFQASRDLADASNDVVMDYLPLGETPEGERRAQALFLRKDVVAAAKRLAEAAGLRLAAIAPRPFALAALCARVDGEATVALFAPGERGGEFVVARGGEVLFGRPVPGTATESPKALAMELKRNLTVASGMPGVGSVGRLIVAESPDALPSWADRLAGLLPVTAESLDPLAGFGSAADLVPANRRGAFAGPVGLAITRAASGVLPVNFADPRRPRAEPGKHRPKLLIAALVGVVVLAGVALVALEALSEADADLVALRAEQQSLTEEAERLKLDTARLAAVDDYTSREVVWLDELYNLCASVPDVGKLTVTSYDADPIPPKKLKPNEKPTPGPIATVTFDAVSTQDGLTQILADSFSRDEYSVGSTKTITAQSGSRGTVYSYSRQLLRRPPAAYTKTIDATMPKPPPADDGELTAAPGELQLSRGGP